jgi:hypothetical protein
MGSVSLPNLKRLSNEPAETDAVEERLALIDGHGSGGSSPGDEPKVPSHFMTDVTSPRLHTVN